mmetsp:Transcript_35157/g.78260  ORF Transcript_35157/g.78260 Transcript_35157/m.78260 type:complete len:374 (+) Transcript_35157:107-1228(+)|eukprot:CAMPEP_0202891742 /NCGR_PEP_ID=MMETSP1392-20130828/1728_1 /ASSEMBLY_ACC=CAM_ASM_000868 /TAXON_ID=225041 /ORGANISM="Chlamydomonas chlamydogama, Strain SAG 11-48b" /LENGTH=373 /DNA_ID=CAMNT_0049575589 /DNA_START=106 /DNA_END=1227 /DNA_ORIENTATION=+
MGLIKAGQPVRQTAQQTAYRKFSQGFQSRPSIASRGALSCKAFDPRYGKLRRPSSSGGSTEEASDRSSRSSASFSSWASDSSTAVASRARAAVLNEREDPPKGNGKVNKVKQDSWSWDRSENKSNARSSFDSTTWGLSSSHELNGNGNGWSKSSSSASSFFSSPADQTSWSAGSEEATQGHSNGWGGSNGWGDNSSWSSNQQADFTSFVAPSDTSKPAWGSSESRWGVPIAAPKEEAPVNRREPAPATTEEDSEAGEGGGFFTSAFQDALRAALKRSPAYQDGMDSGMESADEETYTPPPMREETSASIEVLITALHNSKQSYAQMKFMADQMQKALDREEKQIERLEFLLEKIRLDDAYYRTLESLQNSDDE